MVLYTPQKKYASYLNRIGYQVGLLGGICAIMAILILAVNATTTAQIADELRQDKLAMLNQVLPDSLYNNDLLADAREISELTALTGSSTLYTAKQDGQVVGYAFELAEEGYSGMIKLIIAIDSNGSILGVRVISHTETPGLGDKIEIAREDWILGFNNMSLASTDRANWAVKKDGGQFDQFTGATITPRAVVKAVLGGLDLFAQNKKLFIASQVNHIASQTPTVGEQP